MTVDIGRSASFAAERGAGDPLTLELPLIPEVNDSVDFFDAEGEVLVSFLRSAETLWANGAALDCAEVIAELETGANPDELVAVASRAPRPETANILYSAVITMGTAVSTCEPGPAGEAAWAWTIAVEHLGDLGVSV